MTSTEILVIEKCFGWIGKRLSLSIDIKVTFCYCSNLTVHNSTEAFDRKWFSAITYNILGIQYCLFCKILVL